MLAAPGRYASSSGGLYGTGVSRRGDAYRWSVERVEARLAESGDDFTADAARLPRFVHDEKAPGLLDRRANRGIVDRSDRSGDR